MIVDFCRRTEAAAAAEEIKRKFKDVHGYDCFAVDRL
jgi:hypothetical protein